MTECFAAATIPAPEQAVRLDEVAAPELEPGAALLRTVFSEVCGTDVHLRHGRLAGVPYPLIPGHVSVGVIDRLRGNVASVDGVPFREGDLVTFLDVHETCNACYYCLVAKQTTRCPKRRVYGITYGASDGLLGGWAQAIWLKPGVRMIHLPPQVPAELFIGGGCGLVTAIHAVDRAEIRLGQSVAVLGLGPVGQSIVALSALSGADQVIGIGDPAPRREYARRMGATESLGLDIPADARLERVRRLTGGHGVDVVIEASGNPLAVSQALDLVRDGGRVVVCGQYTDNGPVSLNPHVQINRKHVELRGCWGSDFSHFYRAVQLLARFGSNVPWGEMAGQRFPLAQAESALQAVERGELLKAVIAPAA